MTWKAYTDTQALKELAGLRGVAPSVRFLEKIPQGSIKQKIYHVKTNTPIYLWGVEMFQGGYDCVTINKINSDGTLTLYKNGGSTIENFINQDKIIYNFNLTEYPSFDDFWSDPYLVNYIAGGDTTNTTDDEIKKIVKSNFHRCFVFPTGTEGYYKITLDERLNPFTGAAGFIADYTESQYAPVTDMVSRSFFYYINQNDNSVANGLKTQPKFLNLSSNETSFNVAQPIQAVRTECEFKREIIIRVIEETKDIVDGTTPITRRTINCSEGLLDKYTAIIKPFIDGSKNKIGPFHIKGNNTFIGGKEVFKNETRALYTNSITGINTIEPSYPASFITVGYDTDPLKIMNTDLEDLYLDSNMEYAPIQKEIYVGSQVNNGNLSGTVTQNGVSFSYTPLNNNNDSGLRKLKIINARNSIIENLNFFGADGNLTASEPRFRGPNPWWIGQNSQTNYDNRYQVKYAAIDLSGSIIKNCVFEGDSVSTIMFRNTQYGIYGRFIFDGCTFENCTFKRCSFLANISGVGILIKNCKFEKAPKTGSISDSTFAVYSTDSVCIMGCNFQDLGRTMFLEPQGPITNNIVIRCTDSRKSNQHTAGEGITVDATNEGGVQWASANGFASTDQLDKYLVCGNIFIFNESSYSSGANLLLSSYNATTKLNLSAFTTHFNDPGCYLKTSPGTIGNWYNVYMHNYSYGTVTKILELTTKSDYNRYLNCIYQGIPGGANSFGNYMAVPNTVYGNGSQFQITGSPKGNLVNNCSIVDFLDKIQYPNASWYPLNDSGNSGFYGDQTASGSGFKYANSITGEFHKNLSDSQLHTKLNNNENIINNLTKIGLRHI
jgi:hypothetical protein